jgi:hypothetical protein
VLHGFLYSIVVLACNTCDLIGVPTDPGSRRCRSGFCTCRGVASRVVWSASTPGRRSYTNSRVLLTGALVLYRAWCGAPIRTWIHSAEDGSTGLGMAAQG